MSIIFEERPSDSPYIDTVMRGWTVGNGSQIRPSEVHWHLVFSRYHGRVHPLVVGPWADSGVVSYTEGAQLLWVRFKLGAFMPHLPTRKIRDKETLLPTAGGQSFWLHGSTWQYPDYENVETFVERLAREEALRRDPVVEGALRGRNPEMSPRTLRHRFSQATGLSQGHIYQFERAQRAEELLRQGVPIVEAVFEAGYYDQAHLTRSLKRFIGHTPAQVARLGEPE
jgi:hypothetical protein